VWRKKLSRTQLEPFLANMPACLIGMEACVGAHHLSRRLKALGHKTKLMPPLLDPTASTVIPNQRMTDCTHRKNASCSLNLIALSRQTSLDLCGSVQPIRIMLSSVKA